MVVTLAGLVELAAGLVLHGRERRRREIGG